MQQNLSNFIQNRIFILDVTASILQDKADLRKIFTILTVYEYW